VSDTVREEPRLSAIVLGYRAEEALAAVVAALTRELEALGESFEIVLVVNYDADSDDRTPEIGERLSHEDARVRFVARRKEGGMGWDVRSGLAAATGISLMVIDGDGQNSPRDLVRAYRLLAEGRCDVVKGRRVRRHDGLYRLVLSAAYNLAFAAVFGTWGLWDINGKPKGMTRAACERLNLRSDDWFLDAELVLAARRERLRVVEIPVEFGPSTARPSFVRAGAVLEFARHMFNYRLRGRP